MSVTSHSLLTLSVCLLSVACMRVAPDHPYDPESPLSAQAAASAEGRILLPDEPSGFSYLDFKVTLINTDYPEYAYPVPVSSEGVFLLEGILPGDYIITAEGAILNGSEERTFVLPRQEIYLPYGQLSRFVTPFVLRPIELVPPEQLP